MNLPPSVAQLQRQHLVLELECIDRISLNADVPKLTSAAGVAGFLRGHLGHRFASTQYAGEMTDAFVTAIRDFLHREQILLVRFRKGQRKDAAMQERLRRFRAPEGVVFVGIAQEKVRVPRTIRKAFAPGGTIPWIAYSTAMVNADCFYCLDEDFGPCFLKFGSYFPYPAKLCLNGHESLKHPLTKRGFFEEVIRENLDFGRPEQVRLIFGALLPPAPGVPKQTTAAIACLECRVPRARRKPRAHARSTLHTQP